MDKLDQLLALYTGRCVDDEAEYFLSVDVSGIEYNKEIKKRMLRYAFKRSRYERKRYAVKVILVACLVAMSVVFTACVSIPKIREAIWGAVIEWYDDHISVKFEEITEQTTETTRPPETSEDHTSAKVTDETETSINTEEVSAPPTTIEQRAYASFLPEGYYVGAEIATAKNMIIDYYDSTGALKFRFSQTIKNNEGIALDSENTKVIYIRIKDCQAVLLEYVDQNCFSLTWEDARYGYNLYGMFSSLEELVQIAEGFELP